MRVCICVYPPQQQQKLHNSLQKICDSPKHAFGGVGAMV